MTFWWKLLAIMALQALLAAVVCVWYWVLDVDFNSEAAKVGLALTIAFAGRWASNDLDDA